MSKTFYSNLKSLQSSLNSSLLLSDEILYKACVAPNIKRLIKWTLPSELLKIAADCRPCVGIYGPQRITQRDLGLISHPFLLSHRWSMIFPHMNHLLLVFGEFSQSGVIFRGNTETSLNINVFTLIASFCLRGPVVSDLPDQ